MTSAADGTEVEVVVVPVPIEVTLMKRGLMVSAQILIKVSVGREENDALVVSMVKVSRDVVDWRIVRDFGRAGSLCEEAFDVQCSTMDERSGQILKKVRGRN